MQTPDGWPIREVFIDESSQTKHRFLVLGALSLPLALSGNFEEALRQSRLPELPAGEMGWTKVSRTKLPAYRRLVDCFFASETGEEVEFHSLVLDTTKLDHQAFNRGSRELGFNKEVYQLCQKQARLHRQSAFHVYPDGRNTPQPPEELRQILNFGARKVGDRRPWPFRRVQFRDSSQCLPIQLTDILTGAIAYRLNAHHEAEGASPAKVELSEHVLRRAGIASVATDTALSGKFTIWHRQLRRRPAILGRERPPA